MKGNNELILNQATMIEAVQYWLDSKMLQQAPKVTSVIGKGTAYDNTFTISLDSDADRSAPTQPAA